MFFKTIQISFRNHFFFGTKQAFFTQVVTFRNVWQCTFYESQVSCLVQYEELLIFRWADVCVSALDMCWASFSRYLTEIHESTPPCCTKTGSRSQRGGRDERKWGWEKAVFCPCKVNGCTVSTVSRHSSRAVSVATATASHLALRSERSGQERVKSGASLALPHWLCTSSTQRVKCVNIMQPLTSKSKKDEKTSQ